ncbi:chemotaxis protein CheW [Shigella flexneri]
MSDDLVPFTFNSVLENKSKITNNIDEDKSLTLFQEKLTKELKNLPTVMGRNFILLKLSDDSRWLMNITDIKETSVLPEVSKIGMTQPWIMGISNFRGTVGTIIDMKHFLLGKPSNTLNSHAILLNKKYNLNLALLWPQIDRMETQSHLEVIEEKSKNKWIKNIWVDKNGSRWNELDVEELLKSKEIMDAVKIR